MPNVTNPKHLRHVGPLLREARKSRGLSMKALAERLGSTPAALCFYEHAKNLPSLYTFYRLCIELELDPTEVLFNFNGENQ